MTNPFMIFRFPKLQPSDGIVVGKDWYSVNKCIWSRASYKAWNLNEEGNKQVVSEIKQDQIDQIWRNGELVWKKPEKEKEEKVLILPKAK